jgi:hypothetical protein
MPPNSNRTTVVIPNWNGRGFLGPCLTALRAQVDSDFRAVVVDNGSEDGSAAFVEEHFPEAQLVRFERNRGFAAAANAGIAAAAPTPYVAFLNNDCEPGPNWLHELVACLDRHPRAAAATSKLIRLNEPEIIDGAGDILSSYFRAYERGRGEHDGGQYDHEVQVFGASGAASLWRQTVFGRIGTFDEAFFAYYEDVDLSFRARLGGYELWYAPRAVVRHHGAGTSRRAAEFAYFHSVRNRWTMLLTNVPGPLLALSLPRLLLTEALTVGRALRERQARHVLRAYGELVRSSPAWLRRRRRVQSGRVISTRELRRSLTSGYPQFRERVRTVLRHPPSRFRC